MSDPEDPTTHVAGVIQRIEGAVGARLRKRLVDHGVAAYSDEQLFERVRTLLQHAADGRNLEVLLLPELLGDDVEWTLEPNLKWSTHRPAFGQAILFAKRRILLPLTRWLFEYSQSNFKRQARLNKILLSCIEELAIENARLRRDLETLASGK